MKSDFLVARTYPDSPIPFDEISCARD
jgi:hypothetical protein